MSLYAKAAALSKARKSDEPASQQRQDTAREHFTARQWKELWQFKKTCKKSWEALGFTSREIETIKFYKPDWI